MRGIDLTGIVMRKYFREDDCFKGYRMQSYYFHQGLVGGGYILHGNP